MSTTSVQNISFSVYIGPVSTFESVPRGCTCRQTSSSLSHTDEKSFPKWSYKDFESPHKGEEWASEKLCSLTHCQHPWLWRSRHWRVSKILLYTALLRRTKFFHNCSGCILATRMILEMQFLHFCLFVWFGFICLKKNISWVNLWFC